MKITIRGRVPSKKNSKRWLKFGGRMVLVPSKAHNEWHEAAMWEIKSQRPKTGIKNCEVELVFYMPDNRATDLSNKAESVMDALVDAGVIEDDKWQVVHSLLLRSNGVDKKNPRVEITIKEYDPLRQDATKC